MKHVFVFVGILSLLGLLPNAARSAEIADFKPLPTENDPSTFALTEDGRWLVVAHLAANHLTIWDVKQGDRKARIDCPSPRSILARGGKVFVASDGVGEVLVYQPGADWKLEKKIPIGTPSVHLLSAPAGRFFDDKIVASTGKDRRNRSVHLIDIKEGKSKLIFRSAFMDSAWSSAAGSHILLQACPNCGPLMVPYAEFISGNSNAKPEGIQRPPGLLSPIGLTGLWSARGKICAGDPPLWMPTQPDDGTVFADVADAVFYVGGKTTLSAHRADAACTRIWSMPIRLTKNANPCAVQDNRMVMSPEGNEGASIVLRPPQSCTLDGTVYLFLTDGKTLWRCEVRPQPADQAANPPKVVFEAIPSPLAATFLALTEDDQFLVLAHEQSNAITVWDVRTGALVKRLATPAPRYILCRGGRTFVANYGKGTVSIFENGGKWELKDQLQVGKPDVYFLSAPQKDAFKGKLIAGCRLDADRGVVNFLVDVAKDSFQKLNFSENYLQFSADGLQLIGQSFGASPGGLPYIYNAGDILTGRPIAERPNHQDYPLLSQVGPIAGVWFGGHSSFAGVPLHPQALLPAVAVVPDRQRGRFYGLSHNSLRTYRIPGAEVSQLPASTPAWLARYLVEWPGPQVGWGHPYRIFWSGFSNGMDMDRWRSNLPQAVTIGDRTFIFTVDLYSGLAHRAEMPAAETAPQVATDRPAERKPGEFVPIATEEVVTTMALSEDGRHLAIAHEKAGKLSIWDVAEGKRIKLIPSASPRSLLFRGESLYAASFDNGAIGVYSRANDWKLQDEVKIGGTQPYQLSAPKGPFFKGEILVTCGKSHAVWLVNVSTGARRMVRDGGYPTNNVSYNGSVVVSQSYPQSGLSMGGHYYSAYQYTSFIAGKKDAIGQNSDPGLLHQTQNTELWFSGFSARPGPVANSSKEINHDTGMVIPDVTRRLFYHVQRDGVAARTMDDEMRIVGRQAASPIPRISLTDDYYKFVPRSVDLGASYVCAESVAATVGEKLVLFYFDMPSARILRCELKAFKESPEPPTADGNPSEIPAVAAVDRKLTVQLKPPGAGAVFTLVKGPRGMSISRDGLVTWTPSAADLGAHEIKVRIELSGEFSFLHPTVEVVSSAVAAAGTKNLGQHVLQARNYHLTYGMANRSILLLDGSELRILDADGLTAIARHDLGQTYSRIFEREEYYVALAEDAVHILDNRTLKTTRKITLDCDRTLDLVLHPSSPVAYVALLKSDPAVKNRLDAKRLALIDEKSGTARPLNGMLGEFLGIDPGGRYLYAGLHDIFGGGYVVNWDIGRVIKTYRTIDALISYDIKNAAMPRRLGVNLDAGQGGTGISVAPDGSQLAYLSRRGHSIEPDLSGTRYVATFDAWNIELKSRSYALDPAHLSLTYHPMLSYIAGAGESPLESNLRIYDRSTGRASNDLVNFSAARPKLVKRVLFSPGGRHLLVEHERDDKRRLLQAFPLNLDEKARLRIAEGVRLPDFRPRLASTRPSERVDMKDLDALTPPADAAELTPKEIGRRYLDAVVLIKMGNSASTGFFVGRSGYILSCAHGLNGAGEPVIEFRRQKDGKSVVVKSIAKILKVDTDLDLALLRINPGAEVPAVKIDAEARLETGENITIIGHPGLGEVTLNYTMTTGIVSNPDQKLDSVSFIQTNAAVNPGSSGGPLFNGKGRVVGLVVLKAKIENAAFAVPVERIVKFLKFCAEEPVNAK